jgi:translocating chain-associated membrane protein 1
MFSPISTKPNNHQLKFLVRVIKNLFFVSSSFVTLVLSFLTFYYGIGNINFTRGSLGLVVAFSVQGLLIFRFITSFLNSKRESKEQSAKQAKKLKPASNSNSSAAKTDKVKNRKKESDLPEADQNTASNKKVKSK